MQKRPLSIAMIGHKRIPSRDGGIEVVVEELSTRMALLGCDVTCFNRRGRRMNGQKSDENQLKEYKNVKLRSVLTINRKGLAAMTSSFFGAIKIAFGKYDVAHFHAEGPCAMLWLPKLLGKRCVATIHGLDHQRQKWGKFASAYIMWGEKVAARCADEIIVLSKAVQDYFEKTYRRGTIFIPNGVERPTPRQADFIQRDFMLDKDGYFLFLGRLVPEKGIHYLIQAFQTVMTEKKLVIAGSPSDTDEYYESLRQMAKSDERIVFTDFVQGSLLEELYSNAYVYLLPSDLEGMPLSLLEAMSYGNYCITSDISECTEVVEQHGISFKHGDVDDLASKLQDACNSPETVACYKEKASDFICNKYNWDAVVAQTIKLYEKELNA